MQLDFTTEGSLEGVITLSINRNDYAENLDKSFKKYQKTMRFPGFRVGKTPLGLVKKQLETELVRDEVNKLIQSKISEYYTENKETIIFMPMMDDLSDDFTWENTSDFTFTFKVAQRPEIKIDLSSLNAIEAHKLALTDEELEKEIANLRKQYGDIDRLDEVVDDENLVTVFRAVELNEDGNDLDGGLTKMVRIEGTKAPKALLAELLGKKNEDVFNLDLKAILTEEEICELLEIEKVAAKDLGNSFKITMQGSIILKDAELNEAFFEKVFYDNTIKDEETFRSRVSDNLKSFFDEKAQSTLLDQTKKALLDSTQLELPLTFLKEWFNRNANLKETDNVDEKMAQFIEDTRWDLILEKLGDDFSLTVSDEEIKGSIRSYVIQQYAYQIQNINREQIEGMVDNLYKQEHFRIELRQNILANKVVNELKNKSTFTQIELNKAQFEEFVRTNEL